MAVVTPLLTRLGQLAIEKEGTSGTAETIEAADAFEAFDITLDIDDPALERNTTTKILQKSTPAMGGMLMSSSFSVYLKGSGAAGTAPAFGDALQSCWLKETVTGSTSVAYVTSSTTSEAETATVKQFLDGKYKTAKGCVHNLTISGEAGGLVTCTFEGNGIFEASGDLALLSPTYQTTVPQACINTSLTFSGPDNAGTIILAGFELNLNNEIIPRMSINAAQGVQNYFIGGRNVQLTVEPEEQTDANRDFYDAMVNATPVDCDVALAIGGTAGNICTITLGDMRIISAGNWGDRDGIATHPLVLQATDPDADCSIVFT